MISSRISHRRDFGIGDDDGEIGEAHRESGSAFDPGRAVANDPIEPLAHLVYDHSDSLFRQRVLVPRLRGRKQKEIGEAFIANQRLSEPGLALRHVDQIIDHPPFGDHDQIEIAQADVKVDNRNLVIQLGEGGSESRGRCRLANATLARGDHHYFGHVVIPLSQAVQS